MTERTVVPVQVRLSEDEFHDVAVKVVSDMVAKHGRDTVARCMGISTRQLGNIMGGSTPAAYRLYNLRTLDADALDPIDRRYGCRSVPRDAVCSSDPVSARLARLLSHAIDLERPDSDDGVDASLRELLALPEEDLRFAASKLAGWVEKIDAYRAGEAPKLRVAS